MADAIDRETMYGKLTRMRNRIKQRRDGPYKVGYEDACKDAIQKLAECPKLETATVVCCGQCGHAVERHTTLPYCTLQNRRKMPDDYCNYGVPDCE